jgi:hypothetical protein
MLLEIAYQNKRKEVTRRRQTKMQVTIMLPFYNYRRLFVNPHSKIATLDAHRGVVSKTDFDSQESQKDLSTSVSAIKSFETKMQNAAVCYICSRVYSGNESLNMHMQVW